MRGYIGLLSQNFDLLTTNQSILFSLGRWLYWPINHSDPPHSLRLIDDLRNGKLKQLQQSLAQPRLSMTINTVNTDGTATTASNHTQRVIGSVDDHIYVQDGRVLGTEPDLPFFEIEV